MALFVTLIVLLILAGVSLNAVFSGNGIFNRANQAAEIYNKAKAREVLEITLTDAQVIKYTEGLTDDELTNKINEVGEVLPDGEEPNGNQVIVDGYIFEIDRSVPKIVDYLGKADGVIITAVVSSNTTGGWIKETDAQVTIRGVIKTYSGGKIKKVTAKKDNTSIQGFSINQQGAYEIKVTESATYIIEGEDTKGKSNSKAIVIEVKIDRTAPTVEKINAIVVGNKIRLSAEGNDIGPSGQEESGIRQFNYTITPEDGASPTNGMFGKLETIEIDITKWTIYTIKVTATDKCDNTTENAIEITVDMRDLIPPVIDEVTAEGEQMKIKITAIGHDDKSGLKQFHYTIIPTDGLEASTGVFKVGETAEIISKAEKTYTIVVKAEDNVGNITPEGITVTATTIDGLTVEQAKELVNATTLQQYIGTKVAYNSPEGGTWRVFYYDAIGDFGPSNTLYLKRDVTSELDEEIPLLDSYENFSPSDNGILMKRMNPQWGVSSAASSIDLLNERFSAWLCDPVVWQKYKSNDSSFAVGSPSIEMYVKAYNVYKQNNPNGNSLVCKLELVTRKCGYLVGANGEYNENNGFSLANNTIDAGKGNIFLAPDDVSGIKNWFLCSPSAYWDSTEVLNISYSNKKIHYAGNFWRVCPIVPLDR